MERNAEFCKHCGDDAGQLKVYRDPFGEALAPGRWPTIAMHSDCFLAYIVERKAVKLLSAALED